MGGKGLWGLALSGVDGVVNSGDGDGCEGRVRGGGRHKGQRKDQNNGPMKAHIAHIAHYTPQYIHTRVTRNYTVQYGIVQYVARVSRIRSYAQLFDSF